MINDSKARKAVADKLARMLAAGDVGKAAELLKDQEAKTIFSVQERILDPKRVHALATSTYREALLKICRACPPLCCGNCGTGRFRRISVLAHYEHNCKGDCGAKQAKKAAQEAADVARPPRRRARAAPLAAPRRTRARAMACDAAAASRDAAAAPGDAAADATDAVVPAYARPSGNLARWSWSC